MGCDIHLYIEKMKDGIWAPANIGIGEYDKECELSHALPEHFGRSYDTFAILANVRNGMGFAGCDIGDGFVPISMPKGLPTDVSPEIRKESDFYGEDGHSHSYFTLRELLRYDWTQKTKCRGMVTAEEYYRWTAFGKKDDKSPESYCGGVSGKDVKIVTEDEMIKLFKDIPKGQYHETVELVKKTLRYTYCKVEWAQFYYERANQLLSEIIPIMLALSEGDYDGVRIVFWFDN